MLITVTQDHIDQGQNRSTYGYVRALHCPVGLALTDAGMNLTGVLHHGFSVSGKNEFYQFPDLVTENIGKLGRDEDVEPFSFEVDYNVN